MYMLYTSYYYLYIGERIAISPATQGTNTSRMSYLICDLLGKLTQTKDFIACMIFIPGSCSSAGFSGCCMTEPCKGEPPNCYCDSLCHTFKDCCPDANELCKKNDTTIGNNYSSMLLRAFQYTLISHNNH
jgi:hypothetical protein